MRWLFAASAFSLTSILLSSCATAPTAPNPAKTTDSNSVTVDEFFTPPPTGNADDYYVLSSGDDDVEYSYFLDEQDYFSSRDVQDGDNSDHGKKFKFAHDLIKNGHGYGDHNHIHVHLQGPHHYHGIYIGVRDNDWTDSLALTAPEKLAVDTAIKMFHQCADAGIDTFKVDLKPYRLAFRTKKLAILAQLDSGKVTRDSARVMLDSAITLYLAQTDLLRKALVTEVKTCLTELDVFLKTRLTADQYAIWVRHRGW